MLLITSRGMKEKEMVQVADLITETIENRRRPSARQQVKTKVEKLCRSFPIYEGIDQLLWS